MDITANYIADKVRERLQSLVESGDLAFAEAATRADYLDALRDRSISNKPGAIIYAVPGVRTSKMPGKNYTSDCEIMVIIGSASSQSAHSYCNTADLAVFNRLQMWRIPSGDFVQTSSTPPLTVIEGDIYAIVTHYSTREIINIP